jgi:hypothetical protein
MLNTKEIEAIKRRLQKEEDEDHSERTRQAKLSAYAKKSAKKMRKSKPPKKGKRDFFSAGVRLPGSAFSRGK